MAIDAREELAELLSTSASVAPCVQLNAKASDLRIDVQGAGRLRFPVSAEQARSLLELAAPAQFGRGTKTLTDAEVRDTWEVPRHLVRAGWSEAFEAALATVRDGFGLPPSARLTAELHSLLVYEPGQFFLPHQDSEKHDTMIGTLVVTLPSVHTGGELVIYHGAESRTHRGWKSELALVAFHSDRRHEVRPVSSGFRLALTYNLLLDGAAGVPVAEDAAGLEDLQRCLRQHLTTGVPNLYRRGDDGDAPKWLVYLLDHEYTERGLSWSRLKGADLARASRLRVAARRAGCEAALALSEVEETWGAYEAEPRYGRRRYWDDDEPETPPDDVEYELQELLDSSITLTCWVEGAETSPDISLQVKSDEVCTSTPSDQLQPASSQYEGYMGNYGNTLDRLYRRAAVVVWLREASFAIRAEGAPSWALDELLRQATAGQLDQARSAAATLAPFWDTVALPSENGRLFETALRVAAALDDAQLARSLLGRFDVEELRARHAAPLAALAERYGDAWLAELLGSWFDRAPSWRTSELKDRMIWLTSLPELCPPLLAAGDAGTTTAATLLELSWPSLAENLRQAVAIGAPSQRTRRLRILGRSVAALLSAAGAGGSLDTRDRMVEFFRDPSEGLNACLLAALRVVGALPPAARRDAGFEDLAGHCLRLLRARLSRPVRADDDWSLAMPAGCRCDLCGTLGDFLRDRSRHTFEWPLAEQRRRHVHARIEAAELPVRHETRRSGRPYTLVLTKSPQLFERERLARRQDQDDVDWLTAPTGTPPAT